MQQTLQYSHQKPYVVNDYPKPSITIDRVDNLTVQHNIRYPVFSGVWVKGQELKNSTQTKL